MKEKTETYRILVRLLTVCILIVDVIGSIRINTGLLWFQLRVLRISLICRKMPMDVQKCYGDL